jgi:Fur family iron response transcriptional regulator
LRRYSQILERLRDVGLRPTSQRLALAKLLFDGEDRHVTADMLHGEAMENHVRVSLATVYNTLHQFTEAGMLREIVVDSGRSFFDSNTSEHQHFFHQGTRQLEDISGTGLTLKEMPSPPEGTEITSIDIVIRVD